MRITSRIVFIAGVIGFCWIGAGCGYSSKTILPKNIKTIYIETVKNKIPIEQLYAYHPGLEMDITNAVSRRVHTDGNLRIVPKEQADAILQSDLIGYEQEGVRFNNLESVEEYRLFIVMSLKLVEAKTGEIIWKEENFSGEQDYFVTDITEIGEDVAVKKAIDRLARNIVDRIVEDW